ncbi:MAG: SGNH/GDSL hydrolase family protein [Candidatus Dormibacteria bacterium]
MIALTCACTTALPGETSEVAPPGTIRYLAIGDSYTIGTGASVEAANFPSRLADRLQAAAGKPVHVTNLGVNGFTSLDVISNEMPEVSKVHPDLVTILVGVNDAVQNYSAATYRDSMDRIFQDVSAEQLPGSQVVSVSIPDWTWVPTAGSYGKVADLKNRTDTFNSIGETLAHTYGFTWVSIAPASGARPGTNDWLSSDNLHPGDAQYEAWAELIWTQVGATWSRVKPRS